jgi:hypothetical protein
LDETILLLADANFDAIDFLHDLTSTGAQFLVLHSSARRSPIRVRFFLSDEDSFGYAARASWPS